MSTDLTNVLDEVDHVAFVRSGLVQITAVIPTLPPTEAGELRSQAGQIWEHLSNHLEEKRTTIYNTHDCVMTTEVN